MPFWELLGILCLCILCYRCGYWSRKQDEKQINEIFDNDDKDNYYRRF